MRKLFLDDMRKAPDFTWDVVRSFAEFIAYVELHGVPDVISFDHDLGDEHYAVSENITAEELREHYKKFIEKTGYDCAKWLVDNNKIPKKYLVHSMNPVGAANIHFIMSSAYKRKSNWWNQ